MQRNYFRFKVVWVCPLSDKKFREPIFVRKHIFNKHMDKVEAAKKDNAIFYNNYLKDPRRPSLPEAPYHLLNQYYPSLSSNSNSNNHTYRGRGSGRGNTGGSYRGYRNNSLLSTAPSYVRGTGTFQVCCIHTTYFRFDIVDIFCLLFISVDSEIKRCLMSDLRKFIT